jgi:hypothetical protein
MAKPPTNETIAAELREAELQADARVNAPEPARGTPSITPAADADCASQHSRQGAILVDWVGRIVEAASGARLDVYSHKHTFGAPSPRGGDCAHGPKSGEQGLTPHTSM